MTDKHEIRELILRFHSAMDDKDWTGLRSCLAPVLHVDYTDFRGTPPQEMGADHYVKLRKAGLSHLVTKHQSTNHRITIDGDIAECLSDFHIHRVDPTFDECENTLDTTGTYAHSLERTANAWKIRRIRQTVQSNVGNPRVHGAFRG